MESKNFYPSRFESLFPQLVMRESRRVGGVSGKPYESLNLGLNTADSPSNVETNRKLFFEEAGIDKNQIVGGVQVHQNHVLNVNNGGFFTGYDAFTTETKGIFLTIGIADCTPILIYDSKTEAIGAAHAGWRGTCSGIVCQLIHKMKTDFGTNPVDCYAFIGTCIDTFNFEVGEEVAHQFDSEFVFRSKENPKPYIDLKAANQAQLLKQGIRKERIDVSPFSTVLNNDLYFSYRKEHGLTGRMLALIGVRKKEI